MKNILLKKLVLFMGMFLMVFSQVSSQTHYFSKSEEVVFTGDRVVIFLGEHVGDIQWQSSSDSLTWHDIAGAHADSLVFVAESPAYYRARVVAGICDPFYSETSVIQPVDKKEVVEDVGAIILPELFVSQILEEMELFADDPEYDEYVDEIMHSLISLHDSIMTYYSAEEFQEAIEQFYADFYDPQKSGLGCDIVNIGLGYAKGLSIDQGVSGSLGLGVVNKLKAHGGGGIEIIYDLVNQTSQVYVYSFCSPRYGFGIGLSAAISAGYGFTGYISWLTGIPELRNPGMDLFTGSSRTKSIELSKAISLGLGVDLDLSYSRSGEIDFNCEGVITFLECPSNAFNAATIPEGISTFSFGAGAGAKVGYGIEFAAYMGTKVNCHLGIPESYDDYHKTGRRNSKLAVGLRMAANIISPRPLDEFSSSRLPTDMIAASAAFIYAVNDLAECNRWTKPVVETIGEVEVEGAGISYRASGRIVDRGGTEILDKGVALKKESSDSQTFELFFSSDSDDDTGVFNVSFSSDLHFNTSYKLAAYATNAVGTSFGKSITFSTYPTSPSDGKPCPGMPTVTDSEGNIYKTVMIGDQCWMKENLKTTRYRDGTQIQYIGNNNSAWENNTTGAYTWYNNDHNWKDKYGALYNSYAATNTRGICPPGWHVPTDREWMLLEAYLGMPQITIDTYGYRGNDEGIKIKSCRQVNSPSGAECSTNQHPRWNNHQINHGTDIFGFSGLPAGGRDPDGSFRGLGEITAWWGPTHPEGWPFFRNVNYTNSNINRGGNSYYYGLSIRCLKDQDRPPVTPIVKIVKVYDITQSTIKADGNVTSTGGAPDETIRGFIWKKDGSPTIENNDGMTEEGLGAGVFTSRIMGLSPETTYYIRAYATNSSGTSYGEPIEFTTHSLDGQPCPGAPTVTDIDGNIYKTVLIGDQCWMGENLRTTRYRNGIELEYPESDNALWLNNKTGAYAIYPHEGGPFDGGNIEGINTANEMKNAYGLLYNWYAVNNTNGICPLGWHVPSDAEWTRLEEYLKDYYFLINWARNVEDGLGNALKSCRQNNSPLGGACKTDTHPRWFFEDIDWGDHYGNDAFSFSALPAGHRSEHTFHGIGNRTFFWTSSLETSTEAYRRGLSVSTGGLSSPFSTDRTSGFSIRCVKSID